MDDMVIETSRAAVKENASEMMSSLIFEPFFCPRAWGGRRLQNLFDKALPVDGSSIGESWEISGHPVHVSQVADGRWQGTTINQLWAKYSQRWTKFRAESPPDLFPLLVKFLDCHEPLSVQVHPSTAQARLLKIDTTGKTEAWVVMHAEPGSILYAGWKPGVQRADVERHLAQGTLPELLNRIAPVAGEAFVIPSGTVHAIGGGLVILEVQQCSDATLRLYDWNRPQNPHHPRPLHVNEALDCIDWSASPVQREAPQPIPLDHRGMKMERLVTNRHFLIDRITLFNRHWTRQADELAIWVQVSGRQVMRDYSTFPRELSPGQVVMALPHNGFWEWRRAGSEPAVALCIRLPSSPLMSHPD